MRSSVGGEANGTICDVTPDGMGRSEAPLFRGRIAPLGTNATKPDDKSTSALASVRLLSGRT